jgi:hypothetical protein
LSPGETDHESGEPGVRTITSQPDGGVGYLRKRRKKVSELERKLL